MGRAAGAAGVSWKSVDLSGVGVPFTLDAVRAGNAWVDSVEGCKRGRGRAAGSV